MGKHDNNSWKSMKRFMTRSNSRSSTRIDFESRLDVFDINYFFRSIEIEEKDGLRTHPDSNVTFGETTKVSYELSNDNPLDAKALCNHHLTMQYGKTTNQSDEIRTEIFTESEMKCDLDNFHLKEHLKVVLNDDIFFEKTWNSSIPRIFV